MRDIIEEALIIYRAEVDSFLTIITPAAGLGLILLIVSDTGLTAALVTIPLLLVVYLATYAACIRQAGSMVAGGSYAATRVWLDVLGRMPHALVAAAPAGILIAVVAGCAVVLSDQGFWYLGMGVGLLGLAGAGRWASKHAYDQPLIIVYEARALEALETGSRLAADTRDWTLRLLAAVFAPLAAGGLISAGLAWLMAPIAGAAIFLLLVALWLPFGALCLTEACLRLVDRADSARQQVAETPA